MPRFFLYLPNLRERGSFYSKGRPAPRASSAHSVAAAGMAAQLTRRRDRHIMAGRIRPEPAASTAFRHALDVRHESLRGPALAHLAAPGWRRIGRLRRSERGTALAARLGVDTSATGAARGPPPRRISDYVTTGTFQTSHPAQ